MKKYVYVLDYSDGSISEIEIDEQDDVCEILTSLGFDLDYCYWMITTERKEIIKLNKNEKHI